MRKKIEFLNPDGLHKNPAFSQMAITSGQGKTIYIGGQNAVNAKGELVGKGSLESQTDQVMHNLKTALLASGATFENVVKMTIYILQGQNLLEGFKASQKVLGSLKNPPTITGLFVAGLAHPDYLVEVDAIAFLPE